MTGCCMIASHEPASLGTGLGLEQGLAHINAFAQTPTPSYKTRHKRRTDLRIQEQQQWTRAREEKQGTHAERRGRKRWPKIQSNPVFMLSSSVTGACVRREELSISHTRCQCLSVSLFDWKTRSTTDGQRHEQVCSRGHLMVTLA